MMYWLKGTEPRCGFVAYLSIDKRMSSNFCLFVCRLSYKHKNYKDNNFIVVCVIIRLIQFHPFAGCRASHVDLFLLTKFDYMSLNTC